MINPYKSSISYYHSPRCQHNDPLLVSDILYYESPIYQHSDPPYITPIITHPYQYCPFHQRCSGNLQEFSVNYNWCPFHLTCKIKTNHESSASISRSHAEGHHQSDHTKFVKMCTFMGFCYKPMPPIFHNAIQ